MSLRSLNRRLLDLEQSCHDEHIIHWMSFRTTSCRSASSNHDWGLGFPRAMRRLPFRLLGMACARMRQLGDLPGQSFPNCSHSRSASGRVHVHGHQVCPRNRGFRLATEACRRVTNLRKHCDSAVRSSGSHRNQYTNGGD